MFEPLPIEFLVNRGFCCGSQCKNCPYNPRHTRGTMMLNAEVKKKLNEEKNNRGNGKLF